MTLLLPPTPHLTAERLRLPPGPPHSGYHDICPFCPGAAVGGGGHRPLHHTRTESLHPVSLHRSGREAQVHWSQRAESNSVCDGSSHWDLNDALLCPETPPPPCALWHIPLHRCGLPLWCSGTYVLIVDVLQ
ncbi:hypothetical protein GBAR_LOCUS4842 [Geodia barretti]|uniref:Uncharacterized protein n=1 Tax=Geodia barretti TaxID=519541 RepID=A0AA35RAK6_GEOBA|nr:hypothetical protein GBAR_LOCUS4842 [Geodia barretti]